MRPIDEYIVRMQLDNERFKRNAKESVGIFESMKSMFSKPQDKIGALESMATGMDTLISKFDSSSVMFRRVLDNMVDAAMNAGRKMANAITTPIVENGKKRALSIEQAKFQFEGLGMDIEATMESANNAVLGTAFGLDEAATAAAMFGASGMRAGDEMTTALRAISGVAAMTGSSYSDISNVFTSVAGNGRVMGNDLLRLSTRGVNAAATLADHMTKLGDGAEVTEAQVREMVTKGEIDFELFAEAMDSAFGEHATKSSETYAGALSLVNSALGRIGATMFAQGYVDKKNLFNAITPQVNKLHEALKPLINTFNEYKTLVTGRLITNIEKINLDPLIKSTQSFVDKGGMKVIADSFDSLGRTATVITGSIKRAMRNIFDGPTVDGTIGFLELFKGAFESLEGFITSNADNITSVFSGLFAMLDLGWYVVKELVKVFADLFPGSLVGNAFDVAGSFGDMAVAFAESVKEGSLLPAILEGISKGLGFVIDIASSLGRGLSNIFETIGPALSFVWEMLKKISSFSGGLFSEIFSGLGTGDILNLGTAGMILATVKKIAGFLDRVIETVKGSGLSDSIDTITTGVTGLLDGLTDSLKAMTDGIKAKTLLTIAGAIGVLAVSLKLLEGMSLPDIAKGLGALTTALIVMVKSLSSISKLDMSGTSAFKSIALITAVATATLLMAGALKVMSTIDKDDMAASLGALVGVVTTLVIAMKSLSKIDSDILVGATTMIGLAAAVRILAGALKVLGKLELEELGKGMLGISGIMLTMGIFARSLDGTKIKMSSALAMVVMAGAIRLMAGAVKSIGSLDFNTLAKGLGGMAVILSEIAIFSKVVETGGMMKASISMTIMAVAISSISKSVERLGSLSLADMAKGLAGIATILVEVGLFAKLVRPGKLLTTSASMVVLAAAIQMLVGPIETFGNMGTSNLVKGVGALGIVLAELVVAMNLSTGGIAGAAAMVVMAGALNLIIRPIRELGEMELGNLAQGVIGLAAAMGIIGVAGLLLGPIAGTLLAFGGALMLVGVAVGIAGIGFKAIGDAMVVFSNVGSIALDNIIDSMGKFLDELIENTPKVIELITTTIIGVVEALADAVPRFVMAGADLILGLLEGIAERLPDFIDVAADIILALIEGIATYAPELIVAGFDLIVSLVSGMADALEENGQVLVSEFLRLFGEILILVVEAGTQVISALFGWIPGVEESMATVGSSATEAIRSAFKADEVGKEKGGDFAGGISSTQGDAYKAGHGIGDEANTGVNVADLLASGELQGAGFVKGISSNASGSYTSGTTLGSRAKSGAGSQSLFGTGENVGRGFASGITARGVMSSIWSAGKSLFARAKSAVESAAGIKSPSREMMKDGIFLAQGLAVGMEDGGVMVEDAGLSMMDKTLASIQSKADLFTAILGEEMQLSPRVTPVLDLSGFDTSEMDNMLRNYSRETTNRYANVRNNQNGNNWNNREFDRRPEPATKVEYHAHLTTQGSLPTSAINRMAKDFDNAIKKMEDRHKINRGESVRY